MTRAACLQLTSGEESLANVAIVADMVAMAVSQGADLIVTPEMTSMMESRRDQLFAKAQREADDPALVRFQTLARDHRVWLLIGSMPIKLSAGALANRSFLIAPDGTIQARYDKIHMFDVDLGQGEAYRESRNYQPGTRGVVVDTDHGPIGMSVCYDLRFPHLYRAYAKAGAKILTIPAAFTKPTGEAHWHVLLRARAIECGAYVLAPAQCGTHAGGRQTYGHSLIVSPWGEVLADGGITPGLVIADLDLEQVALARSKIPSLNHDRPFELDIIDAEHKALSGAA